MTDEPGESHPWDGDDDYSDPELIDARWTPDDLRELIGSQVLARLLCWDGCDPDDRLPHPVRRGELQVRWSSKGLWVFAVDGHCIDPATVEPVGCCRPTPPECDHRSARGRQRRWIPAEPTPAPSQRCPPVRARMSFAMRRGDVPVFREIRADEGEAMGQPASAERYVLKPTDVWHPDEGDHGLIWSGGLGRWKAQQYFDRPIFATDGVTLLRDLIPLEPPDPEVEDLVAMPGIAAGDVGVNSMPDLGTFSPDDAHFARFAVGVAQARGAMFEGRVIECQVARLLGAELPDQGTSPWDLRVEGISVEVKSARDRQRFSLKNSHLKQADVWVFARKIQGYKEVDYFVLSAAEVENLATQSVEAGKLEAYGPHVADELAAAVRAAAAR